MNNYPDHPSGDDDPFAPKGGPLSTVRAFDAFPKTKPSYTQKTQTGGLWTVVLLCASLALTWSELSRWWVGETTHAFSVEQGIGHDLQINLDVIVAMKCGDLHVNVQDASGDRILASSALTKDATMWAQWGGSGTHVLGKSKQEREREFPGSGEYRVEDVHEYLGAARRSKKFAKTPRLGRGKVADACRVFGSLEGNKVQGDFHITARGHGYMEFGQHLGHEGE